MNLIFLLLSQAFAFDYSGAPCTFDESWTLPQWHYSVEKTLDEVVSGDMDSIELSSQLKTLEKTKLSLEKRSQILNYIKARALFSKNKVHRSLFAFETLLSKKISPSNEVVQSAALGCVSEITKKLPSAIKHLNLLPALLNVFKIQKNEKREFLFDLATKVIAQNLKNPLVKNELLPLLISKTTSYPPYHSLALILKYLSEHNFQVASSEIENYFNLPERPESLQSWNPLLAMLGIYFFRQSLNVAQAEKIYSFIPENSNDRIMAMREMLWLYYQVGQYEKAAGIASGLQAAPLNAAFAPESLIVGAMLTNNMCHYTQAFINTELFIEQYKDSIKWLSEKHPKPLLDLVLAGLSSDNPQMPYPLFGELIRSQTFISNYEEILLIERELKDPSLSERDQVRLLEITSKNKEDIERELQTRLTRIREQLDSIVKQAHLVRIEALQGGSTSLILEENDEALKAKLNQKTAVKIHTDQKTWNWGLEKISDRQKEVWEDEIGTLQLKLTNLCHVKDN